MAGFILICLAITLVLILLSPLYLKFYNRLINSLKEGRVPKFLLLLIIGNSIATLIFVLAIIIPMYFIQTWSLGISQYWAFSPIALSVIWEIILKKYRQKTLLS